MAKRRKKKRIGIILRKLGSERAWGLAYSSDFIIHLDERVRPKMLMINALHESQHCINPSFSETKVERDAQTMSSVLWRLGYRLIYNENKRIKPMIRKKRAK